MTSSLIHIQMLPPLALGHVFFWCYVYIDALQGILFPAGF